VFAFLWSLEFLRQQFEFLTWDLNFGHIEPDSELAFCDETGT
jgi:hypothetical protein